MYTQQELDAWLQRSIRLFPSVDQWMKIWRDAKSNALRHLSDQDFQALMTYLERYYQTNRPQATG